jgi:hypothetical protein
MTHKHLVATGYGYFGSRSKSDVATGRRKQGHILRSYLCR